MKVWPTGDQRQPVNQYLTRLSGLRHYIGLPGRSCEFWLEQFDTLPPSNTWGPGQLPLLLALVHPDFYFTSANAPLARDIEHERPRMPTTGMDTQCQIWRLVKGAVCPFGRLGEKLRADHYWPYALGGANVIENRLSLCRTCNGMKAHSPWLYDFSHVPSWLRFRVCRLRALKSS